MFHSMFQRDKIKSILLCPLSFFCKITFQIISDEVRVFSVDVLLSIFRIFRQIDRAGVRQAPVFSLERKSKPSMTSAQGENPVSSPNAKHKHNTGKINNNSIVYFLYLCYSLIDATLPSPPPPLTHSKLEASLILYQQ